ncbi:MAG: prepilin-type N-terminal cleavage/methylation domain-containing protein [Zoogloeaceae bacterium]|jgi:type IV pilus assembly protein PilW|nr:prepilin-type N-terminal cleavage/methylation domain-containing protein [Zoogloeaceae bacterium]
MNTLRGSCGFGVNSGNGVDSGVGARLAPPVRGSGVQGGFTLVELMVSAVIGLIVLLAVSYAFIGGRHAYVLNSELMRMQENARVALESIRRDVRMAHFHGCADIASLTADAPVVAERLKWGVYANSGYADAIAGAAGGYMSGLEVHGLLSNGGAADLTEEFVPSDGEIKVQGGELAHQLEREDYADARVLVSDCSAAVILKQTGATVPDYPAAGTVNVTALSGDGGETLFARGAQVYQYPSARAFLVRNSNASITYKGEVWPLGSLYYGGNGLTGDPDEMEELAPGVEAFRVCVVDEAGKRLVPAESASSDVLTKATQVQVDMVLVSQRPEVLPEAAKYEMRLCGETTDGAVSYTATDRRLRRLFSTAITMRNKVTEVTVGKEAHDSGADQI